jgi:hypothetical protein
MDALMVVDPQYITRYQSVGLYINRGALKNRGWLERGDGEKQNQEKHEKKSQGLNRENRGKKKKTGEKKRQNRG